MTSKKEALKKFADATNANFKILDDFIPEDVVIELDPDGKNGLINGKDFVNYLRTEFSELLPAIFPENSLIRAKKVDLLAGMRFATPKPPDKRRIGAVSGIEFAVPE